MKYIYGFYFFNSLLGFIFSLCPPILETNHYINTTESAWRSNIGPAKGVCTSISYQRELKPHKKAKTNREESFIFFSAIRR